MSELLDPTNDYVFKRLFAGAPEFLVHLINDMRPDLPDIAAVEVLNPTIEPSELTGKYIILDLCEASSGSSARNPTLPENFLAAPNHPTGPKRRWRSRTVTLVLL